MRTDDTGHVSKLCLKTLLPLKTFIPNFVAFFVLLGIALSCIRKMLSSVTSTKREFTPAIVSLSTLRDVDIAHYLEIANQSDCLKYQRHPVLYMLMKNVHFPVGGKFSERKKWPA